VHQTLTPQKDGVHNDSRKFWIRNFNLNFGSDEGDESASESGQVMLHWRIATSALT
jgi:hypothetical protein